MACFHPAPTNSIPLCNQILDFDLIADLDVMDFTVPTRSAVTSDCRRNQMTIAEFSNAYAALGDGFGNCIALIHFCSAFPANSTFAIPAKGCIGTRAGETIQCH